MRRLMLLRHAKTETDAPSGQDQDRRLDDRGRMDAAADRRLDRPASALSRYRLVSTAVRAQQTWEIAWEAMKERVPQPQVEFLPTNSTAPIRRSCCRSFAWPPADRSQAADVGRP